MASNLAPYTTFDSRRDPVVARFTKVMGNLMDSAKASGPPTVPYLWHERVFTMTYGQALTLHRLGVKMCMRDEHGWYWYFPKQDRTLEKIYLTEEEIPDGTN